MTASLLSALRNAINILLDPFMLIGASKIVEIAG